MLAALTLHRQQHIIEHRHLEVERRLLIAAGDALLKYGIGRERADILAGEDHAPGGELGAAGDEVDQGALARAIGSNQADDGAFRNRQRNIVHRAQPAVIFLQVFKFKQGHLPSFLQRSSVHQGRPHKSSSAHCGKGFSAAIAMTSFRGNMTSASPRRARVSPAKLLKPKRR